MPFAARRAFGIDRLLEDPVVVPAKNPEEVHPSSLRRCSMTGAPNEDPASGASREFQHRPGVGIVLLNAASQIFIGRRRDRPETWHMPQGRIDPGECTLVAARRELTEGLGVDAIEALTTRPAVHRYEPSTPKAGVEPCERWAGQEERWLAMRLLAADDAVDVNACSCEFDDWRWVEPSAVLDRITPFKRQVCREVLNGFAGLLGASRAEGGRRGRL